MFLPEHSEREGMARLLERIRPESEQRDYAGGLQRRVVEHGGEVRGTCLDGYQNGWKSEEGATREDDQAEGNVAEDQR